jgi:arginyl-tRNA synthetase
VITGDLDRALATAISSGGTWQPAPPGTICGVRAYVTTIAFRLARGHAGGPGGAGTVAARLAARLRGLDWVETATVTGGGYLTVTVTPGALAGLAVRITQAGPGCARGGALAGTDLAVPAATGLASARTWEEARQRVHVAVTARLAETAGARIRRDHDAERIAAPHPAAPVTEALAYAGADAITYALAGLAPRAPAAVDARLAAAHHLGNPAYAVRYAHAHAASALRQAADLGLYRGDAAQFQPRLLAHPAEQALLHELSWLPERVAGAARRARPDVFARFLEGLAQAYFDCQEACPAARPGMMPGAARLWLAAAARTALCTGLGLLGVDAPDRL